MAVYSIDFYANAIIEIPDDENVDEYVQSHWEKVSSMAVRDLLDNGEYEKYRLDLKGDA